MNDWERETDQAEEFFLLKEGDSTGPSIFCIPPSGGKCLCYLDLIKELNPKGKVYGITDIKYRFFESLSNAELCAYHHKERDWWPDALDRYADALVKLWRDGDLLMGYSQGGLAAHILSKRLEALGRKVGKICPRKSHISFGSEKGLSQ